MKRFILTLFLCLFTTIAYAGDTTANGHFYLPFVGESGQAIRDAWRNTQDAADTVVEANEQHRVREDAVDGVIEGDGAGNYSAWSPSACTSGQFVTGLSGDAFTCDTAAASDTNANTICTGTDVYLDGEGNCDTLPTSDTNANTICTGTDTYLDGEGNCDTIAVTDTNANTECTGSDVYLDGEGNCDDLSNLTDDYIQFNSANVGPEVDFICGGGAFDDIDCTTTVTPEGHIVELYLTSGAVQGGNIDIGSEPEGTMMYVQAAEGPWVPLHLGSAGACLKSNGSAPVWGGCSSDTAPAGMVTVEEGDVAITTSGTITLDFDGDDFNLTESPANEINITLANAGGIGTDLNGVGLLVATNTGTLDSDRALVAGTNITSVDGGANGNFTLNVDDAFLLNTGDTGTGDYDFSGANYLRMPQGTTPVTTPIGSIALDTSITDHDPLWQYRHAGGLMTIIAIDTSDLPATDDQIIKYDAATNKFGLEADGGAGGSSVWTDEGTVVDLDNGEAVVIGAQHTGRLDGAELSVVDSSGTFAIATNGTIGIGSDLTDTDLHAKMYTTSSDMQFSGGVITGNNASENGFGFMSGANYLLFQINSGPSGNVVVDVLDVSGTLVTQPIWSTDDCASYPENFLHIDDSGDACICKSGNSERRTDEITDCF